MKKNIIICLFLITLLLISNVNTLNARINDKKEQKKQPINKNDSTNPKNTKGVPNVISKQDIISAPSESFDPVLTSEPLPVVKLNVYRNPECTIQADNIEWGEIEVGGSQNVIIYLKNNGNKAVIASLVTEKGYPEHLMDNLELVWDYDGQFITSNEMVEVTLTLRVNVDCSLFDAFSLDIVIIGS